MTKEFFFELSSGRYVKIRVDEKPGTENSNNRPYIWIKDPHQKDYQPVISTAHPKYWKYKELGDRKAMELELFYSGLSKKQTKIFWKHLQTISLLEPIVHSPI